MKSTSNECLALNLTLTLTLLKNLFTNRLRVIEGKIAKQST